MIWNDMKLKRERDWKNDDNNNDEDVDDDDDKKNGQYFPTVPTNTNIK